VWFLLEQAFLKVLLYEPNPQHLRVLEDELRYEFPGLCLETAANGYAAAAVLDGGSFDVVIAPWGADASGPPALRGPDCAAILSVSPEHEACAAGALRPGMDDYVVEPFRQLTRLKSVLRSLLERSAERRRHERLEQALARSRSRFEAVFANTLESILVLDTQARCVAVNPAACELLGYAEPELMGAALWRFIVPEELRHARELWSRLMGGRKLDGELTVVRKDGAIRDIEFRGVANILPGLHLAAVRDLTDRRQADEALRRSEERWRAVFENSAIGIALVKLDGRFEATNHAFQEMTGYPAEELGRMSFLEITQEDDREASRIRVAQLIDGTQGRFEIQKRYLRKDRKLIWVRNSVSLIPGTDLVPPLVMAVMEDITDRLQAEEGLRVLSGRLLKAQDEAQHSMATALHESTAQALVALRMNLDAVERHAVDLGTPAQEDLAESVQLAEQCLREIRTFSYLLHPPLLDEFGLPTALGDYVEGFRKRSGINVALDVSPEIGRLPREFEIVLFRIAQEGLTNIHRHSGAQEGRIRLSCRNHRIVMEVVDNGKGMPSEITRNLGLGGVPGLGVGLTTMLQRMRSLSGTLTIESSTGGTRIIASAPLPQEPGIHRAMRA
jgi:PAS domain S-box-containing protein